MRYGHDPFVYLRDVPTRLSAIRTAATDEESVSRCSPPLAAKLTIPQPSPLSSGNHLPRVPPDAYEILAVGGLASIAFGLVNARRLARRDFTPGPPSLLARLGTAIVVLMVIAAVGVKVVVFFVEHPLPKETSPAPEADIYEWAARESRLKEILAFQRARGIPNKQLDAVLKQVWTESHPDKSPPWDLVLENSPDWWRITFDWDVEVVKQRLLDSGATREESGDE